MDSKLTTPLHRSEAVNHNQGLVLNTLRTDQDNPSWRRAQSADIPAVERLLAASGLPLAGVKGHIEHFLVVEEGGGLVAAIGVEPYGTAGLLRSVVVSEGHRNRGLGRLLVEQIFLEARSRGWKELFLLTETAQKYFEGFGFQVITRDQVPVEVKMSAEFQGACPVSAIVMKRALSRQKPAAWQFYVR